MNKKSGLREIVVHMKSGTVLTTDGIHKSREVLTEEYRDALAGEKEFIIHSGRTSDLVIPVSEVSFVEIREQTE